MNQVFKNISRYDELNFYVFLFQVSKYILLKFSVVIFVDMRAVSEHSVCSCCVLNSGMATGKNKHVSFHCFLFCFVLKAGSVNL